MLVYLSRHEYEIGRLDPRWRLVVVGLDDERQVAAVATVEPAVLQARAPADQHADARWASTRYELTPRELDAGLGFLGPPSPGAPDEVSDLLLVGSDRRERFEWMPTG